MERNAGTSYVGIDLAWGEKARTGIAALDHAGRLRASASVISDEEIAAFLSSLPEAARTIAAIDAPLIVVNETGQRSCEREIARHFGRHHASAHTCNLSKPYMSPQPRGWRIADQQGWSVDPADRTQGVSCAIEVYPHPAMISMFGIERIIPYKYKSGRSVDDRRAAFARLFHYMESHLEQRLRLLGHSHWGELKDSTGSALRHSQLDRVEDEVDAIFCAYLAWLWGEEPTSLVVFGDRSEGFIVTLPPPLPVAGAST